MSQLALLQPAPCIAWLQQNCQHRCQQAFEVVQDELKEIFYTFASFGNRRISKEQGGAVEMDGARCCQLLQRADCNIFGNAHTIAAAQACTTSAPEAMHGSCACDLRPMGLA